MIYRHSLAVTVKMSIPEIDTSSASLYELPGDLLLPRSLMSASILLKSLFFFKAILSLSDNIFFFGFLAAPLIIATVLNLLDFMSSFEAIMLVNKLCKGRVVSDYDTG